MPLAHRIFVLLACLTIAVAASADTGQRPPSLLDTGQYIPDISQFLEIDACSPAGYSWDGKQVYFTTSTSGASQVYRLTKEGWPFQLTSFEDGIDFFTLSWGGQLAIVGASVGGSEQSQLLLLDTETGRNIQLTNNSKTQFQSVLWAPDDKSIYYRSNEENGKDFFIYQMDISNGKSEKIFGDSTTGPRGYNSPAGLSSDGTKLLIYNFTSNVRNDLYLLDIASRKWSKLNAKKDYDVKYISPILMPDNKTLWLVCNDNKDGIGRLAKMTVGSTKVEFINDGWLDPKWDIEGLSVSRDYTRVAAVLNEDGYNRLKLRMMNTGEVIPTPQLDGILGFGDFDKDGNMILSFYSATRVADVWFWNPKANELKQLTFTSYSGIDRTMFREPKLIRYESFDGLQIPAFLYLPPNYQPGTPIPFVIDAHGGPESQFTPGFIRNFQYLMLNGFGVLAPNPRGSDGYGRDYLNLDNYKLRKNSLKDYKAAADYLIKNGYSAQGMLSIRGGSYGGYVVLGMITEYPDLFSAAIENVGIANFKTFLAQTAAYRRALREAEYGPLSDSAFLDEISPINKAHLIKTPLLVVHGANDPRVPIGEARQIIAAIQKNGGIVDSMIFANEGHGAGKTSNTIMEYRKQVEFLNTYLNPKQEMTVPKKDD